MMCFHLIISFLLLSHGVCFVTWLSPLQRRPTQAFVVQQTTRNLSSSVEDLLTEEFAAQHAEQVQETVKFPLIPDPIVLYVLTQAIENLSEEVSADTLQKLQEMMGAEGTATEYDDMSPDDRNALADQIASELNTKIDVPMFTEEQELEVLQQIMRVALQVMTTSDAELREAAVDAQVDFSRNLLQSKESRKQLVQTLNQAVDIPILDESQEETILQAAVNHVADTLESLLPPQFLETLRGASPNGIAETKSFLVDTVTEKVTVVGLSKEQEHAMIETLVDILLDTYVDETEAEFLVLTKEQQEEEMLERMRLLERELELSQRRHEREQIAIKAKMDRLKARLDGARGR